MIPLIRNFIEIFFCILPIVLRNGRKDLCIDRIAAKVHRPSCIGRVDLPWHQQKEHAAYGNQKVFHRITSVAKTSELSVKNT